MQNSQLRFGIVGTGMIAGFIADAIDKSTNAKLIVVRGFLRPRLDRDCASHGGAHRSDLRP